jgi:serine/threonine protein kinase
MTLQAGQLFGNYRVVQLIGEGGFGEVYLVENELIQRRAAVKVLHPALAQDAELVRRFLNEARAASAICHPNIVEVLDAGGTPDGAPYILMEFLEGVSLQKRLADRGPVPLPKVLDIADQAGSALVAAHAAGIVHRDLKPENLFLVPDTHAPGGERVKVLDFGIAKICLSSGSGGTVRTRTGMIIGSPAYMSPEQCKDSADVDVRSDVYSFATILYEMLSGRTPHVAPTGTELLFLHLTKTPPHLRELAPQVPAHVEAVIMRGLAREREDRFDSMESFVAALREDLAAPAPNRIRPIEIVSAVGQSSATVADRTVLPVRSTTFSRATGEVGEAVETEEALLAATPNRRWPVITLAGVVVLGGAMLLILRPNRYAAPKPLMDTGRVATSSATIARPSAPVREEELQKAKPSDQVVVPSNAAADPQLLLPVGVGGGAATKPPSAAASTGTVPSKRAQQAAGPTTSRRTAKEWNSDERWLAH